MPRLNELFYGLARRVDAALTARYERLRASRLAARLGQRQLGLKLLALAIVVTYLADYTLYATCGLRGCPDALKLVAYQPGGASVLLDRNGRKFADLAPVEREMVKLAALPDYVAAAFIAVEDQRFSQHNGVDWKRVAGAALRNLAAGEIGQGSSTITMQLSRNVFSDRLKATDKSLRRKLFEARVAKQIEKRFSKREILELYLNHIYFGGGAYGVQSASRYYFEKPASKLRLHEAALLAAIPKAPSHYDPRNRATRAKARRNLVLDLMAQQGAISGERAVEAKDRRLGVTSDPPGFRGTPPLGAYFVQMVRRELEDELGEDVYTKKLEVYTTLDVNAQRAAEEELARQLRIVESGALGSLNGRQRYRGYDRWSPAGPQYLQGAVVVKEIDTGDIIALVGGRDIRHSRFNRATLASRQAGSAFKPFVYAAAIDQGYAASQPILDSPVQLVSNGRAWEPRNYDSEYYGLLSLRNALAYSRNIPSVRLAAAVGDDDIEQVARATGIRGDVQNTPMVALGITEVTPMELATAIGTFGGMGVRSEPRTIVRVEDESGRVVYETRVRNETRFDPAVSYIVTDMLRDAVDYGTGTAVRRAGFRGPVAGKTGTTSDGADVWFVGYTPDLVAAVWVGYDARRPLPARASGGSVSAPVFGRMMRRIYRTRPLPGGFIVPDRVVARLIDSESGQILEHGCVPRYGNAVREVFLEDAQPPTVCPRRPGDNIFDAIGRLFGDLFGRDEPEPEPEPGVTADGSRDVLGSGRIAKRDQERRRRRRRERRRRR
ncbi:MAG: transglycosylase domain-containing protein, partial [Gemmatimonadota bacterium]